MNKFIILLRKLFKQITIKYTFEKQKNIKKKKFHNH